MNSHTIAIDIMSGDKALFSRMLGCVDVLNKNKEIRLILVGDKQLIEKEASRCKLNLSSPRVEIEESSEIVEMDEEPLSAMRHKKKSSMRISLNLLKEGRAQACVSAGNTGALLGMSMYVIKTLPCIDRPAIISSMPTTQDRFTYMLDLGGSVNCSPEQLFQFAVMGSVFAEEHGIKDPKCALLNVGKEEVKGTSMIKDVAQQLKDTTYVNYTGYIEGNQIFLGVADVIVCDGYVGNVALKTAEGLAKVLSKQLRSVLTKNIWRKLKAFLLKKSFMEFKNYFNPSQYNGASFVGLNKVVVKSHGNANAEAFSAAIQEAHWQSQTMVPDRITQKFHM